MIGCLEDARRESRIITARLTLRAVERDKKTSKKRPIPRKRSILSNGTSECSRNVRELSRWHIQSRHRKPKIGFLRRRRRAAIVKIERTEFNLNRDGGDFRKRTRYLKFPRRRAFRSRSLLGAKAAIPHRSAAATTRREREKDARKERKKKKPSRRSATFSQHHRRLKSALESIVQSKRVSRREFSSEVLQRNSATLSARDT